VQSISDDKGRRVHRREALEALDHLQRSLETAAHNLLSGLAVVVTLRDRLPTAFKARQELLNEIARAVLVGVDLEIGHDAEVRIQDFDIAKYPDLGPPVTEALRRDINEITGTINRQVLNLGAERRSSGPRVSKPARRFLACLHIRRRWRCCSPPAYKDAPRARGHRL